MNPKMPKARWMLQQCSWVCLLTPLKTRYSQYQVGHPTDVGTCDLFLAGGENGRLAGEVSNQDSRELV